MKKKTLIAGIILLALTGCSKGYEPKNIYEDRFVNGFVQTDFGRPRDFIEITDSKIDTIDNMAAMELITAYNADNRTVEFTGRMPARKGFPFKTQYHRCGQSIHQAKYSFDRNGHTYFGRKFGDVLFEKKVYLYVYI